METEGKESQEFWRVFNLSQKAADQCECSSLMLQLKLLITVELIKNLQLIIKIIEQLIISYVRMTLMYCSC